MKKERIPRKLKKQLFSTLYSKFQLKKYDRKFRTTESSKQSESNI